MISAMELTRYADAAEFLKTAGAFLEAQEAENCLALSLAMALARQTEPPRMPPYLAVVTAGDNVRAVAVQTPPHNVVLPLSDAPEAMALFVADLQAWGEKVPGVSGPPTQSRAFAQQWQTTTGRPFHLAFAERIYRLERVQPVTGVTGQMRRATETDRALLGQWLIDFDLEAFGTTMRDAEDEMNRAIDRYLDSADTGMYLWEDGGAPVAMSGHTGPTPHGMRVGPVYTPPESRGHGYASALVAGLSQMLLDQGRRFCFLYTDLANPTSNHIYQAIGYVPVGDANVFVFG